MQFRALTIVLILALAAAACGGGSESTDESTKADPGGQSSSTTTQQGDSSPSTTATPDEPAGGGSTDVGSASVTIGGKTYNFVDTGEPYEACLERFGILQVVLARVNADGVVVGRVNDEGVVVQGDGIGLIAPVDDSGPVASVHFSSNEEDLDFFADPDNGQFPDGNVDSLTVDGHHVEGTATFIAVKGSDQSTTTVTGTFEATCPDE